MSAFERQLDEDAATLLEQLEAARRRSEELVRADKALQKIIAALAEEAELASVASKVLATASEQLEAPVVEYWAHESDTTARLVMSCREGRVFNGSDLPNDPRARGMTIPAFITGADSLFELRGHFVRDLADDPELHAIFDPLGLDLQAWSDERGVATLLNVQLRFGDKSFGSLVAYFRSAEVLTDARIELAHALANQIALAIGLDELSGRTQASALERARAQAAHERSESLEKVNSILTSSLSRLSGAGDMREFLAHVFAEILRVTGASNAAATRYDAESNQLQLELFHDGTAPRWGLSENELALWASPYDADITPAFRIGSTRRRIFAASMMKDQITEIPIEEFALPGGLEWMASIGASDAAVSVLFAGDQPVGTFHLHFTGGRTLRPDDLPLLNALSHQAAIALRLVAVADQTQQAAIARARELEAQKRAEDLARANQALSECIQSLKDIENLEVFLESALLAAERVSGSLGAAAFVYGPDDRLSMKAYVQGGKPRDIANDPTMAAWRGPVEWTARFRERWKDLCGSRGYWFSLADDPNIAEQYRAWHKERGQTLTLCLPLAQGDRFLGFLGLAFANEDEVDPERLDLMRSLAQQTTLAVEANRLALQARNDAVQREQRRAAEERAAEQAAMARERAREAEIRAKEASRISNFLNATLGQMSEGADLQATIESIIAGLAREIGAAHVFLFRHDAETRLIRLELSCIEGSIRRGPSGEELPLWAAPFRDDITPGWRIMTEMRGLFTPEICPIPAEEFAWPGTFEYADRMKLSDMGHIVLFAGDDPVGSIGFCLMDGRKLKPSDKSFIEGIAKQAALAIRMLELAERAKQAAVAEAKQKAAQERAAELGRANDMLMSSVEAVATSADPKTLLERFLLEAIRAAGARGGAFTLYENGRFQDIVCLAQFGELVAEEVWRKEPFILETPAVLGANIAGFFSRLMQEKITRDRLSDAWGWWPAAAEYHRRSGHVEVWNVACIARGQVIASFGLGFAVVPEMHSVESMLIALAQQAALALELHRLSDAAKQQAIRLEQEKAAQEREAVTREAERVVAAERLRQEEEQKRIAAERLHELTRANAAMRRCLDGIGSAQDLDHLPAVVLGSFIDVFGASSGSLWSFDETDGSVTLQLEALDGKFLSRTQSGFAHAEKHFFLPSHAPSYEKHKRLIAGETLTLDIETSDMFVLNERERLRQSGTVTLIVIPLSAAGRHLGRLALAFDTARALSPAESEIASTLATQASLVVEMTRLADTSKRLAVAREQERATMEERSRLAREIHDTLAQSFSGIIVQLRAMQRNPLQVEDASIRQMHADNALELASIGLAEARRSLASLRVRELEGRSLREALTLMAQSTTKRSGIPVRVEAAADLDFGVEKEPELLRIAQESVTNAVKHSGASEIVIALRQEGSRYDLCVEDNGKGFDQQKATEGFGLIGMQERADRIGATIGIETSGAGTAVCVHVERGGPNAS